MENNRDIIKNFRKLKPGDVIWGARYRTEEHKISIPEGHRAGPYLIVRIEKKYCIVYMGQV